MCAFQVIHGQGNVCLLVNGKLNVCLSREGVRVSHNLCISSAFNLFQQALHRADVLPTDFLYAGILRFNLFQLTVMDLDGNRVQLEDSIVFKIHPPFWQSWWFLLLTVIALGFIVFGLYQFRINQRKEREIQQIKLNKRFAELELQALQAQMNPHFIFNVMASVRSFILENNTIVAADYLAKFAKLMRLFLESSNTISPLESSIACTRSVAPTALANVAYKVPKLAIAPPNIPV